MAPSTERMSRVFSCSICSKSAITTRICDFVASTARASSSTAGAMTQSIFVETIALAVSTSIGRFRPTTRAECGQRIGFARADVRIGGAGSDRGPARVGVLDERRRGLVELQDDSQRRIEVQQIGIRELFSLQQLGAAKADLRLVGIPGGRLVRVLAVAKVASLPQTERDRRGIFLHRAARETSARESDRVELRRDRGVVLPGVRERLPRQLESELARRSVGTIELRRARVP